MLNYAIFIRSGSRPDDFARHFAFSAFGLGHARILLRGRYVTYCSEGFEEEFVTCFDKVATEPKSNPLCTTYKHFGQTKIPLPIMIQTGKSRIPMSENTQI